LHYKQSRWNKNQRGVYDASEAFFASQNAQIHSKCHKFLKVKNAKWPDLGLQSNGKKSHPHHWKKPKIDLWEITGCAQIQEIERPDHFHFT
jgi:hypothetical protein